MAEYKLKLRGYSPVAVIILHQELGSLSGQVDRGTQKTNLQFLPGKVAEKQNLPFRNAASPLLSWFLSWDAAEGSSGSCEVPLQTQEVNTGDGMHTHV